MRAFAAALLAFTSSGAAAQSSMMADVIGQTVAGMNSGWTEDCMSLEKAEKPKSVERFKSEAEPGLRAYLALASTGANPAAVYKRNLSDRWAVDGVPVRDLAAVRDPWAKRVSRLEPVGILLGRSEIVGHGIWRAYAADDRLLGTYEAEMIRKTKGYAIGRLNLWSPGQEARAKPLTPFCGTPGDHQQWAEAKAAAEARKAQRRAEKAAQRKGSQP